MTYNSRSHLAVECTVKDWWRCGRPGSCASCGRLLHLVVDRRPAYCSARCRKRAQRARERATKGGGHVE